MEKNIVINPTEAIAKRYAIRWAGKGNTLETCIPVEAVEREARRKGMTLDEFLESYEAECLFNNFGGLHIRFVEKAESKRQ